MTHFKCVKQLGIFAVMLLHAVDSAIKGQTLTRIKIKISKRSSMMSFYDDLDDLPDLDENINPDKIKSSGEIKIPNEIDLMEYLNDNENIFW